MELSPSVNALAEVPRCQFCDEPLCGPVFSDAETVDAKLGTMLCGRRSCIQERAWAPLQLRVLIYESVRDEAWRR